jgi:hypothetical protein
MNFRGTYYNRNVIWPLEKVTDEWKDYCITVLNFNAPEWTQKQGEAHALNSAEKEALRAKRDAKLKEKR